MAIQQLGNETTTAYAEGLDLVMERVFNAPRDLVWRTCTNPDSIARWWGPAQYETTVEAMDVRPGGRWRFVQRAADGGTHPFTGEYLEVEPPARLVQTFIYDVEPYDADVITETYLFEALDGDRTRIRTRSTFPSADSLQGALSSGMIGGAIETWDRLEALLRDR